MEKEMEQLALELGGDKYVMKGGGGGGGDTPEASEEAVRKIVTDYNNN